MIEIETFELFYQVFWLVLALGGAAFILALLWNLHTENKRREKAYEERKKLTERKEVETERKEVETERKEVDKEIEMLFDRLYHIEVVTNNLKYDFELCFAKTRDECKAHYKGKEIKVNLDLLYTIREDRLNIIEGAKTNIQREIIEDYLKRKKEG